jgi:hypothetical protein
MSRRAYGILFYGIPYESGEWKISEKDSEEDLGPCDIVWRYLKQKGENECPAPGFFYRSDLAEQDPAYKQEWEDYFKRKKVWDAKQCNVNKAGFSDGDTYYLYIEASYRKSMWGEMVTIENLLARDLEWDLKLRECVEALGLPWKEPGWYLTSYYG